MKTSQCLMTFLSKINRNNVLNSLENNLNIMMCLKIRLIVLITILQYTFFTKITIVTLREIVTSEKVWSFGFFFLLGIFLIILFDTQFIIICFLLSSFLKVDFLQKNTCFWGKLSVLWFFKWKFELNLKINNFMLMIKMLPTRNWP